MFSTLLNSKYNKERQAEMAKKKKMCRKNA